jgi:uncharacterized membrane protein
VVHFPVALLSVAWLLALFGAFGGRAATGLRVAAAVVMVLGVAGAFLAVETGEAAADRHRSLPPAAAAVLEQHEEEGESTRTVFGLLAALYVALLAAPRVLHRAPSRAAVAAAHLGFVAVYLVALAVLLQAASLGGELVHRWGVSGATAAEWPAAEDPGGRGPAPEDPPEPAVS